MDNIFSNRKILTIYPAVLGVSDSNYPPKKLVAQSTNHTRTDPPPKKTVVCSYNNLYKTKYVLLCLNIINRYLPDIFEHGVHQKLLLDRKSRDQRSQIV